jgi:hypothetical protein
VKRVSDGKLVTDSKMIAVGDEVEARLASGALIARVTSRE